MYWIMIAMACFVNRVAAYPPASKPATDERAFYCLGGWF